MTKIRTYVHARVYRNRRKGWNLDLRVNPELRSRWGTPLTVKGRLDVHRFEYSDQPTALRGALSYLKRTSL